MLELLLNLNQKDLLYIAMAQVARSSIEIISLFE